MKNSFNKNIRLSGSGALFLVAYLIVFSILLVVVLLFSREETHMTINKFHSGFLDILMKYWTYLGDGLLLLIFIFGLLLISFRYFFTSIAAYAFGGLGSQLLKHLFFKGFARPLKYFDLKQIDYDLHLVPGVDMHTWFSFPSGHTATAFAVFFSLALMAKMRISQTGLFVLALGVGFSRIYLSQHFLMDVVGGSFLGMIAGYLAWIWMKNYKSDWLDLSLPKLLKR